MPDVFEPVTPCTIPTLTLASLAAANYAASGNIPFNEKLMPYAYFVLSVTFAGAPTASSTGIKIYQLPAPDGSTFASGSASVVPSEDRLIATLNIPAQATQVLVSLRAEVAPFLSKLLVMNNTDQTISSATLTLYLTNTR